MCFDTNLSVKQIFDKGFDNVRFRRTLWGDRLDLWTHIKDACAGVALNNEKDVITWTLTKNKKFTVKSMYKHLVEGEINLTMRFMWKIKVPARIKFFMWLLEKKILY